MHAQGYGGKKCIDITNRGGHWPAGWRCKIGNGDVNRINEG